MYAHIMDSEFYRGSWSTPEMRAVFLEEQRFDRWLKIEAALARAQAKCGILSQATADEITRKAHIESIDLNKLKHDLPATKHTLMPLLRQLQEACEKPHGEYIHFGAATQDIEDTGLILEMKAAFAIIFRDLLSMEQLLGTLALKYKHLTLMGRAHNQHGSPITLGFKFASLMAETRRTIERMKQAKPRIFVCLLHGGVGSQAGLGPKAAEVTQAFAQELGLEVPVCSWAFSRDILAEYLTLMAFICGTVSRAANELYQLSRTEILELHEPLGENYVGSSTMPHKRNAEVSEFMVALCRIVTNNSLLGFQGMMSEHERDARSWRMDWHNIPESSLLTAKALAGMNFLLRGIQVYEDNIARNMHTLNGQVAAERILLYCGQKIGKQTAHQAAMEAASTCREQGISFTEAVRKHPVLGPLLNEEELEGLMDYNSYTGTCAEQIENVIALSKRLAATDA